ncbi:MAG: helix-turn-helix transcriptional regulator [Selenomonadaceae bacterium]|nr:helix-turn-helix transcriptional regulator [Selenomonadaceae bacterium]
MAFAQKLGFGEGAVSAWMMGKCEPKLSTAIRVKEVLGVDMPLEELFAKEPAQQSE